jgi:hypothetical protein
MLMVSTRRKTWVGKKEEPAVSSQAEENMALARRFMEARIKGNLEAVDEMMAPDFVNHTSPTPAYTSRTR